MTMCVTKESLEDGTYKAYTEGYAVYTREFTTGKIDFSPYRYDSKQHEYWIGGFFAARQKNSNWGTKS